MIYCICGKVSENQETGECASCAAARRKAMRMGLSQEKIAEAKKFQQIRKVSVKQQKRISDYSKIKAEWIKDKMCVVFPTFVATDVHHSAGRIGFVDEWAKENNIPALLDVRYWKPVSRVGHIKIELSPVWAKEKGFSVDRLSKK